MIEFMVAGAKVSATSRIRGKKKEEEREIPLSEPKS